jgi:hypothetical protein
MSSGQRFFVQPDDPIPYTLDESNAVLKFPLVDRNMRRPITLNSRDFDIPYLAGYSLDGLIIYIDRDLKKWLYQGTAIDCKRFLLLHEHTEKSIIDAVNNATSAELQRLLILLRMEVSDDKLYLHAHGVATAVETYAVKLQYQQAGLVMYNRFMATQIKRADDERIRRVPSNLDLLPYRGDTKLLRVMEESMVA